MTTHQCRKRRLVAAGIAAQQFAIRRLSGGVIMEAM
jgi:hypothetical protein